MSLRNFAINTLLLIAALVGGFFLSTLREKQLAIGSELESLNRETAKLELEAKNITKSANRVQTVVPPVENGKPKTQPTAASRKVVNLTDAEFLKKPDYLRLFTKLMWFDLQTRDAALFNALGLPEEKRLRLRELLTRREVMRMELGSALARASPDGRAALAAEQDRAYENYETEICEMLQDSSERLALYKSYQKALPFKESVDNLDIALEGFDARLNPDQYLKVMDVVALDRQADHRNGIVFEGDVVEKLASVLNPRQLAALRAIARMKLR